MAAKSKFAVSLGQEVFVLSREGEVVHTVVGKIEKDAYAFLNGDGSLHPHWFSFEEAVAVVADRIGTRRAALYKEIDALAQKRRTLRTKGYRDGVMSAPYKVVDLRDTEHPWQRRRPGKRKRVHVLETYLRPGQMAYAIITPLVKPFYEGASVYRPHKHFVLETEVESVCVSPNGEVSYRLATPFVPEEFFPSREEAKKRLESYPETGEDPIHFVSSAQEKEELAKAEEDIPF